jgi:hypothetical protein
MRSCLIRREDFASLVAPAAAFDAILASHALYYGDRAHIEATHARLVEALREGGLLVAISQHERSEWGSCQRLANPGFSSFPTIVLRELAATRAIMLPEVCYTHRVYFPQLTEPEWDALAMDAGCSREGVAQPLADARRLMAFMTGASFQALDADQFSEVVAHVKSLVQARRQPHMGGWLGDTLAIQVFATGLAQAARERATTAMAALASQTERMASETERDWLKSAAL